MKNNFKRTWTSHRTPNKLLSVCSNGFLYFTFLCSAKYNADNLLFSFKIKHTDHKKNTSYIMCVKLKQAKQHSVIFAFIFPPLRWHRCMTNKKGINHEILRNWGDQPFFFFLLHVWHLKQSRIWSRECICGGTLPPGGNNTYCCKLKERQKTLANYTSMHTVQAPNKSDPYCFLFESPSTSFVMGSFPELTPVVNLLSRILIC